MSLTSLQEMTMQQQMIGQMKERFDRVGHAAEGLKTAFENAAVFSRAPSGWRDEAAQDKNLSPLGIGAKVRDRAAGALVPGLRHAQGVVERARSDLASKRAALSMPPIDRTDVIAADHRREARALLRSLPELDRTGLLMSNPDPLLVAAALEAPDILSGINPRLRAGIGKAYAATHHAKELTELDDREEAIAATASMVEIAKAELRKASGLDDGGNAFENWFAGAGPRAAA